MPGRNFRTQIQVWVPLTNQTGNKSIHDNETIKTVTGKVKAEKAALEAEGRAIQSDSAEKQRKARF